MWLSSGFSWKCRLSFLRFKLVGLVSERVVQWSHEQLQFFEGAAVTSHVRRLVFHNVTQVFQLLTTRSAFLMSEKETRLGTQFTFLEQDEKDLILWRRLISLVSQRLCIKQLPQCLPCYVKQTQQHTFLLVWCRLPPTALPLKCLRSGPRSASWWALRTCSPSACSWKENTQQDIDLSLSNC